MRQGREGHFVEPEVEIELTKVGVAGLVALKTLSVLSPSPA
jgi:hypothetical protein